MPEPLRIVLASHNEHKRSELQAMLPADIELLGDPNVPAPEEDGPDFAANALIKARAWARATGMPTLADDSGLEVFALAGAPGVYSARFSKAAPGQTQAQANNAKLLEMMSGIREREAQFRCVLALLLPRSNELAQRLTLGAPELNVVDSGDDDFVAVLAEGCATGRILRSPVGADGFGYDPLFLSDDLRLSFAQAEAAAKNAVSHRGRALAKLLTGLQRMQVGSP